MQIYVVIEMTYDHYQSEQFLGACKTENGAILGACKTENGAIDLAARLSEGREIVMEGEPPHGSSDCRHNELADDKIPHILIVESELHE
jgi:hypothetical protein